MAKAIKHRHRIIPAVYIIFRDQGGKKVLLMRRYNTGYRDGWYSLPGGHVGGADETGGEPAIMAAVREAKEEGGVDISLNDLQLVHAMHRLSTDPELHERVDFCFEATRWQGELANAEPDKCDELCWAPLNNLPTHIVPEVRHMLRQAFIERRLYSDLNFD